MRAPVPFLAECRGSGAPRVGLEPPCKSGGTQELGQHRDSTARSRTSEFVPVSLLEAFKPCGPVGAQVLPIVLDVVAAPA